MFGRNNFSLNYDNVNHVKPTSARGINSWLQRQGAFGAGYFRVVEQKAYQGKELILYKYDNYDKPINSVSSLYPNEIINTLINMGVAPDWKNK